jgi:hypothetical protein
MHGETNIKFVISVEVEGTTILQNVGNYTCNNTAWHSRRLESSELISQLKMLLADLTWLQQIESSSHCGQWNKRVKTRHLMTHKFHVWVWFKVLMAVSVKICCALGCKWLVVLQRCIDVLQYILFLTSCDPVASICRVYVSTITMH